MSRVPRVHPGVRAQVDELGRPRPQGIEVLAIVLCAGLAGPTGWPRSIARPCRTRLRASTRGRPWLVTRRDPRAGSCGRPGISALRRSMSKSWGSYIRVAIFRSSDLASACHHPRCATRSLMLQSGFTKYPGAVRSSGVSRSTSAMISTHRDASRSTSAAIPGSGSRTRRSTSMFVAISLLSLCLRTAAMLRASASPAWTHRQTPRWPPSRPIAPVEASGCRLGLGSLPGERAQAGWLRDPWASRIGVDL